MRPSQRLWGASAPRGDDRGDGGIPERALRRQEGTGSEAQRRAARGARRLCARLTSSSVAEARAGGRREARALPMFFKLAAGRRSTSPASPEKRKALS